VWTSPAPSRSRPRPELDGWLGTHAGTEAALVVALFKKATGKQTVSFGELQQVALCHGWVDTLTQSIDDERYAIRFVPRSPGSSWSETNRRIARRLRDEGRMTPGGLATLPEDL
jgi:uncharacterized protein YdeI (YjbR/CyaY-like superfamily)